MATKRKWPLTAGLTDQRVVPVVQATGAHPSGTPSASGRGVSSVESTSVPSSRDTVYP
jgi:hypothetical protein